MQVVYEKIAILDEYLVDHFYPTVIDARFTIWTVYCRLSHVSRRPCRRYKHYLLMNGTASHRWILVYDASQRSYVEDKLSKENILTPIWRPTKISPPKVDKPTYGTELYHHVNVHADRREISVPWQNTYFWAL